MGSDDSDDDAVTEINVGVDPSMISEITITRTGASPIRVSTDTASAADSEPTTLEPQLLVRGLGPAASIASLSATFAEAPRRPAPIPAAGRPPEPSEWETELSELSDHSEVTARPGANVAALIRASAARDAGDDDYEEETKTDAVQAELVATARARAQTVPILGEDPGLEPEDPGLEPEETRTAKAPPTTAPAQALFLESAAPRRPLIGVDEARAELDAKSAAGGTVRMFYNPATGKVAPHPDSERSPLPAPRPAPPFGEQPTVQALPLQQNPALGAPAIVRNPSPASLDATVGSRPKPRRVGRLVLLFVLACATSGAGVHYRHQIAPWVTARLPASWRAPRVAVVTSPPSASEAPAATTMAASAGATGSAGASASADADASTATPASTTPMASVSASPSASGRRNKRGPPPRR